jgi:hypothetical protein
MLKQTLAKANSYTEQAATVSSELSSSNAAAWGQFYETVFAKMYG